MKLTLLVPCHNAARFLPHLWQTVLAQTVQFSECICYDDASTDSTYEVAQSFGARVLRSGKQLGAAHARNQLWRAAKSAWVHFHDADDLLEPRFVERMQEGISDKIDVAICNASWQSEDSRASIIEWRYSESDLQKNPISYLLTHPVGGINGLYRRSILESIHGFDETLAIWEDADLHVRLALAGARFRVVEEPLVVALRRADGRSANMLENWRNRLQSLRKYSTTLPSCNSAALIVVLEKAARELIELDDIRGAHDAIMLAMSRGGNLPTTTSRFIKVCKSIFGPIVAMRIQQKLRSVMFQRSAN